ncbi:MAG: GTP cyclohydrolase I FolE2 [Desulfobulbaceae bacterium]|nr:GTP cyclohydrolase I FolE2 [Desulfobulbaceae bacterium]
MKDIQNLPDSRRINIRKVGVKGVSYPVIVLDKAHRAQKTIATVNMYVNLPHHFKGTHMSRFVEILNRFHDRFTLAAYQRIMEEMKELLDAEAAHLEMCFPYFFTLSRNGEMRLARYTCRLYGSLADELDLVVAVDVPVPALSCADAKPAPTMWGLATVAVRMRRLLWIEDLIALVEEALTTAGDQIPTVENACATIGAALEKTNVVDWYKVLVKNTANGYAGFAAREWPDERPPYGPLSDSSVFSGLAAAHNL